MKSPDASFPKPTAVFTAGACERESALTVINDISRRRSISVLKSFKDISHSLVSLQMGE